MAQTLWKPPPTSSVASFLDSDAAARATGMADASPTDAPPRQNSSSLGCPTSTKLIITFDGAAGVRVSVPPLRQSRLGHWEEAEHACLICVWQAPLSSAAFRLLGEIARWHKKDVAESALYRFKVYETRRRLVELRQQKTAEARAAAATPAPGREVRPMPELQPHPETLANVPANQIITVVSGLPRSGTSVMMQILEAAGIPPFTDHKRKADESNRKGYYEHAQVSSLNSNSDRSWLRDARGTAIKIVAPLLAALPPRLRKKDAEPEPLLYRIIFMERDMEEILQSQAAMLRRLGKAAATGETTPDIGNAYQQQERHAKSWSATLGVHAMSVNYDTLVHSPDNILPQLAAFLNAADKLAAMRACIDPALHHTRADTTRLPLSGKAKSNFST